MPAIFRDKDSHPVRRELFVGCGDQREAAPKQSHCNILSAKLAVSRTNIYTGGADWAPNTQHGCHGSIARVVPAASPAPRSHRAPSTRDFTSCCPQPLQPRGTGTGTGTGSPGLPSRPSRASKGLALARLAVPVRILTAPTLTVQSRDLQKIRGLMGTA